MKQLINIKTIFPQMEYRASNAKTERTCDHTDLDISRDKGGFSMKSRLVKVNIDTFDARNSVIPTAATSIRQNAEIGKKAAYDAIARFVEEGYMLVNDTGKGGDVLNQIFAARVVEEKRFELAFVPKYPAVISWTPPDLEMSYELDKLTFNWRTNKGKFEFAPADFEIDIKEYPSVIIEYVGDPIYAPPSASPHYEPVDVSS